MHMILKYIARTFSIQKEQPLNSLMRIKRKQVLADQILEQMATGIKTKIHKKYQGVTKNQ